MRKALTEPTNKDHVPLKALFPPEFRKKHKPTKLVTVRVHKGVNSRPAALGVDSSDGPTEGFR